MQQVTLSPEWNTPEFESRQGAQYRRKAMREQRRENMSKLSYVQRVSNGAALLDEVSPGWEKLIDLDILDLSDGHSCIVGQVFGDWITGLDHITSIRRSIWTDAKQYGFQYDAKQHGFQHDAQWDDELGSEIYEKDVCNEYKWLARRWRELITARLAA